MLTGYYQKKQKKASKKPCEQYQNLSKEERNKKHQYGREQYRNLSEDKKQRLVEYRKKYCKMKSKNWLILLLMITDRCIKYKNSKI